MTYARDKSEAKCEIKEMVKKTMKIELAILLCLLDNYLRRTDNVAFNIFLPNICFLRQLNVS